MSLLSDGDELNTQCLQTVQFAFMVPSQTQSVQILRKCPERHHKVWISCSEFVMLRQQVTETDGAACFGLAGE